LSSVAKAAGVSLHSVQWILEAHRLAPHRIRTFNLSTDPEFAEMSSASRRSSRPCGRPLDEKSQIQALDRTQPGCR
jgi:hypothetical protein